MSLTAMTVLGYMMIARRAHIQDRTGSLTEDLARVGLDSIPLDHVRAQKALELARARPGILKILAPLTLSSITLTNFLSLRIIPILCGKFFDERPHKGLYSCGEILTWLLYAALVIATGFIGVGLCEIDPRGWLLLIPDSFLLFAGTLMLITFWMSPAHEILTHWVRTPLAKTDARFPHLPKMPSRLLERAAIAQTVEGAEVKVEHTRRDPFLLVERRRGLRVERAYIGAWNTGDQKLDTFLICYCRRRFRAGGSFLYKSKAGPWGPAIFLEELVIGRCSEAELWILIDTDVHWAQSPVDDRAC